LFAGPRGTGKTSMARLVAKTANCINFHKGKDVCNECEACLSIEAGSFMDMIEIDAASNRGIDEIRQIKENVNFSPSMGKHKVYIIDEVHMLTREAFNALLKTLEEPPEHVVFVLATTEPHKIPATILSRVQRFDFRLATESEMITKLKRILDAEKIQLDEEGFSLIFKHSGGSYRDAESLLGKLIANSDTTKIDVEQIIRVLGIADAQMVSGLVEAILTGRQQEALELIDTTQEQGLNLAQLSIQMIDYLREQIRVDVDNGNDYTPNLRLLTSLVGAYSQFRHIDNPKLLLEIVILQYSKPTNHQESSSVRQQTKALRQTQMSKVVSKRDKLSKSVQNKLPRTGKTREINTSVGLSEDKWKMIVKNAKTSSFRLMTLLRGCEPKLNAGTLTLITNFNTVSVDLNSEELKPKLFEVVSNILPELLTIEILVEGKGEGTKVVSDKLESNANLVESIF